MTESPKTNTARCESDIWIDWRDNTSRIREERSLEDVKEFQERLAEVKHRIAFP